MTLFPLIWTEILTPRSSMPRPVFPSTQTSLNWCPGTITSGDSKLLIYLYSFHHWLANQVVCSWSSIPKFFWKIYANTPHQLPPCSRPSQLHCEGWRSQVGDFNSSHTCFAYTFLPHSPRERCKMTVSDDCFSLAEMYWKEDFDRWWGDVVGEPSITINEWRNDDDWMYSMGFVTREFH